MPEISILFVNYNDKKNLRSSLESLQVPSSPNIETIVIDNASTDGSQSMLKEEFPDIHLIQNHENMGFSKACNQGFRISKGSFILYLNPDTVLEPSTLNRLYEEMRLFRDTGAAGPVLIQENNAFQVSFGSKRTFLTEIIQKFLLNPFHKTRIRSRKKRKNVAWLSGACLFLRREALEDAGGFDENFFLYYEDIDLCYRIKQKGWNIVLIPEARTFHKGGASTGKDRLLSRYYYRKSQLYFYKKHNTRFSCQLLHLYLRILFLFLPFSQYYRMHKGSLGKKDFYKLLKK